MSKPVQLVARFGQACLTIEPVAPHTGADITKLLNDGKAVEQGDVIIQWADSPAEGAAEGVADSGAEGGIVIARILSHNCQPAAKAWEVVEDECGSCLSTPRTRDRERLNLLQQWAWDLMRQKRLDVADEVIILAYTLLESIGNPPAEAFVVRTANAQLAQLRGDLSRSATLCEKALDNAREAFGDTHVQTAIAQCNLADALSLCGRFEAAKLLIDAGMSYFRNPASVNDQYSQSRLDEIAANFLEAEARINEALSPKSERDPLREPAAGDVVWC